MALVNERQRLDLNYRTDTHKTYNYHLNVFGGEHHYRGVRFYNVGYRRAKHYKVTLKIVY